MPRTVLCHTNAALGGHSALLPLLVCYTGKRCATLKPERALFPTLWQKAPQKKLPATGALHSSHLCSWIVRKAVAGVITSRLLLILDQNAKRRQRRRLKSLLPRRPRKAEAEAYRRAPPESADGRQTAGAVPGRPTWLLAAYSASLGTRTASPLVSAVPDFVRPRASSTLPTVKS